MDWNVLLKMMKSPTYLDHLMNNLNQSVYCEDGQDIAYQIAAETVRARGTVTVYGIKICLRRLLEEEGDYTKQFTGDILERAQAKGIDILSYGRKDESANDKVLDYIQETHMLDVHKLEEKLQPVVTMLRHLMKKEGITFSVIEEALRYDRQAIGTFKE